jgi:hypothetical protein
MVVDVDEPRRHDPAVKRSHVGGGRRRLAVPSDGGEAPTIDRDPSGEAGSPRAVDDGGTGEEEFRHVATLAALANASDASDIPAQRPHFGVPNAPTEPPRRVRCCT